MESIQRSEVVLALQRKILQLEGFRTASGSPLDLALSPLRSAFPNGIFPVGAVHEFLYGAAESKAATSGFISGLLSVLMARGGIVLWINSSRILFPPALKAFGIQPDRFVFVEAQREKDIMWTMDEALKCDALTAVVCEVRDIDFTASRRLQLAVEQSHVTGFVLRSTPSKLNSTACVSRWKITHQPSESFEGLPGIGVPQWKVELLKVRNGKPGRWIVKWETGKFQVVDEKQANVPHQQRKAG